MKKKKLVISIVFVVIALVWINSYFNSLQDKLAINSQIVLEVDDMRKWFEEIGQNDFYYSECFADSSFFDMWFPWTFDNVIEEGREKKKYCLEKYEVLKGEYEGALRDELWEKIEDTIWDDWVPLWGSYYAFHTDSEWDNVCVEKTKTSGVKSYFWNCISFSVIDDESVEINGIVYEFVDGKFVSDDKTLVLSSEEFDIEEEKEESIEYNEPIEREFTSYLINDFSNDYYWEIFVSDTDESEDYIVWEGYIVIYNNEGNEILKVWSEMWFVNFYFNLPDWKDKSNLSNISYKDQSLIIYKDFDFDGDKDFAIKGIVWGCSSGYTYDVYLATDEWFIFNNDFSTLTQDNCGMFEVKEQEKEIHITAKSGCCWYKYSHFIVEWDVLKVIYTRIEELEWEDTLVITTSELVDWEWKETEEKKKVKQSEDWSLIEVE